MKPLVNQIDISTQFNLEWFFYSVSRPNFDFDPLIIPGRNGYLDKNKIASRNQVYTDREIILKYGMRNVNLQKWIDTSSALLNTFNGREVQIKLEAGYHYIGICELETVEPDKNRRGIFEFTFTCQPFKFKDELTTLTLFSTAEGQEHIINNLFAQARPTITAIGSNSAVLFGDTIYQLLEGDNYFPEILFLEGDNKITCIGAEPITFTWQEGKM